MHVTHFWTLEGVGYADALFHLIYPVSAYYCWGLRFGLSGVSGPNLNPREPPETRKSR